MTIRSQTRRAVAAAKLPDTDAGVAELLIKLAGEVDFILGPGRGLGRSGKLDNVSIPTFLKVSEALGMTPSARSRMKMHAARVSAAAAGGESPAASTLSRLRAVAGGPDS